MEELSTIFNNVGILVAALAGGISLVMFGFAGIQYMTAQGDPQGMSKAKMSVIGAVVGLAIAGLAFVMPGIISRLIVEPAGGQNVAGDSVGANCDQLLKNQLVFQRGASTAGRMGEVIRQIQATRDNCVSEMWDPHCQLDMNNFGTTGCWPTPAPVPEYQSQRGGSNSTHRPVRRGIAYASKVRGTSGRDSRQQHHRVLVIRRWTFGQRGLLDVCLPAEQLGRELLDRLGEPARCQPAADDP